MDSPLAFAPMDQREARVISGWRYEGPYSFYDADADPEDLAELLDPRAREGRYFSAFDDRGELVGFFFFKESGGAVEVGLGLRPDLTGKGHGLRFLLSGLEFAGERFSAGAFRLSVATFNRRAIRVYRRAGFRPAGTFLQETNGGKHEFLLMFRAPETRRRI